MPVLFSLFKKKTNNKKLPTDPTKQTKPQTIKRQFMKLFPCSMLLLNFVWINQIQAKS